MFSNRLMDSLDSLLELNVNACACASKGIFDTLGVSLFVADVSLHFLSYFFFSRQSVGKKANKWFHHKYIYLLFFRLRVSFLCSRMNCLLCRLFNAIYFGGFQAKQSYHHLNNRYCPLRNQHTFRIDIISEIV